MAELRNDAGVLRFALDFIGREAPPPGAASAAPSSGRVLATAGLEYLDRRDGEWWPLVRLPVIYLAPQAARRLADEARALVQGQSQGFAWRPEDDPVVGLQLGPVPGGAVVEVGVDLGAFLAEAAGVPRRAESELGLFRFRAAQADLVRFADAIGCELEALAR
jgi:hypothetical protein